MHVMCMWVYNIFNQLLSQGYDFSGVFLYGVCRSSLDWMAAGAIAGRWSRPWRRLCPEDSWPRPTSTTAGLIWWRLWPRGLMMVEPELRVSVRGSVLALLAHDYTSSWTAGPTSGSEIELQRVYGHESRTCEIRCLTRHVSLSSRSLDLSIWLLITLTLYTCSWLRYPRALYSRFANISLHQISLWNSIRSSSHCITNLWYVLSL